MPDIKKVTENPATSNPAQVDHAHDLADWDESRALRTAAEEGIEMSDAHWEVVHCLREHYREHGPPATGREVADMLEAAFAERDGRSYLRRLFPQGPVAQGMRIGGLAVPPHTEDAGFGTSR